MSEKNQENEYIGDIQRDYVRKEVLKSLIISMLICGGLFGFVFTPLYFEGAPSWAFNTLYLSLAAIFFLLNLIVYVYEIAFWKSFTYRISTQYIRINSGVFTKSKTTIPFSRIQNINIAQGVFDRIFGLHTVKIETAGKSAGQQQGGPIKPEGYIPGVRDPTRITEIIDQLVDKYTQKKMDAGIGDYIFEDTNLAFDEFIAYILSKMLEGHQLKTRVKELREKQVLSQAQLAEEIGVSRQTINYLERGKYVPSLTLAMKIAKFFKIPVEKIFELEEQDE
ncbi:MAG: PH domain-containing protein [Candidatus Lokiarchaeota archaeon]|nr:PH domain-containing protein [Candidatus Lokiarchaeota archaeon]